MIIFLICMTIVGLVALLLRTEGGAVVEVSPTHLYYRVTIT